MDRRGTGHRRSGQLSWLGAFAILALAACSPQTGAAGTATSDVTDKGENIPLVSPHPVSGLEVIPVYVGTGESTFVYYTELAISDAEQARGLMFRTELGPHEAMLFPRDPPDIASFWMKNTPIPLDIVFLDPDGRVINIAANTTPYSLDPVVADGLTGAVLELAGGRAAEMGLEPGDRVWWEGGPAKP